MFTNLSVTNALFHKYCFLQLKALETPEEKRRRRLQKKEAKERKRKEQMGWDNELLHYTNNDNPFGDSNLLGKFVWKKKLLKEGMSP